MLQVNRISSIDWKPSPVLALATSVDGSQVAAAREDGSLEIWLVSPGSVGWHCQLTIHGDPNSRVSSLVYCRSSSKSVAPGRLFSSSIDGSISEWDLFDLKQKIVLDSIGVSIWQMAVEPLDESLQSAHNDSYKSVNGYANDEISSLENDDKGEIDDDDDDDDNDDNVELHVQPVFENPRVAIGCDDGSVRLYAVSDSDGLTYRRSMHRVSGRILSVVWSLDAKLIFAGGSDGFIRCWNAKLAHEIYRITVGHGSLGAGSEICVWSLLFLRSGTLVSADSSGRVQFWDSQHGTLLQAHSCHKGDVNALAASPSHSRVFSAGSDGQIVLYKPTEMAQSDNGKSSTVVRKWVYVGYLRAHTHDVRALTVAVPISSEGEMLNDKVKRIRGHEKPVDFSYHKWAHLGVPMLISAGDDTKLFAYSVKEFTKFAPHDICPAPQRVPIHLVLNTLTVGAPLLLVQCCDFLDVLKVNVKSAVSAKRYGKNSGTQLLARVKCKDSRKIVCCAISSSGVLFAYSDHVKPSLFELKNSKIGKNVMDVKKRELPRKLPFAHSMVFSTDSSQLMIAGHDRKIYVVDVDRAELLYSFTPRRKEVDNNSLPNEPPITKMFTSSDGQWLATANCFGDIYIFNLEVQRQHWFIARLDGASVTAGGFPPSNSSILIITTSSNQVYVFDVEAKQLGEWSKQNTFLLPRRFLEFPGEVIGLSFPPKNSTSVVIYSARAMCLIDFGKPIDQDDDCNLTNGLDLSCKELGNSVNAVGIKRKLKDSSFQCNHKQRRNFNFSAFRDPVHFVGHLSEDSVLVVEKSWSDIVAKFDAPVHRHIFGT